MKLASGQQQTHFIQIQSEIYIQRSVLPLQSTEFLKATHKVSERTELKLLNSSHTIFSLQNSNRKLREGTSVCLLICQISWDDAQQNSKAL